MTAGQCPLTKPFFKNINSGTTKYNPLAIQQLICFLDCQSSRRVPIPKNLFGGVTTQKPVRFRVSMVSFV
jgi:hypothetical protein